MAKSDKIVGLIPARQMLKRPYIRAIVSFLTIPAIFVPAMMLTTFIDPEIALHSSNYERNLRLTYVYLAYHSPLPPKAIPTEVPRDRRRYLHCVPK